MNFITRSIRNKITYSVMFIIILLTVVLASITTYNSSSVKTEVEKVAREALRRDGMALIEAESQVQAAKIAKNVENAALVAETFAADLSLLHRTWQENGFNAGQARALVLNKLRNLLEAHPSYMGIMSPLNPDVFGNDADFLNSNERNKPLGMLDNGRVSPYWYREGGTISLDWVSSVVDESKNGYFSCPRSRRDRCLIDPDVFDLSGVNYLLTTISVPIISRGEFIGVVGVDFDANFVKALMTKSDDALFDGKGEVMLLSETGNIIGYSEDPGASGKAVSELGGSFARELSAAVSSSNNVYSSSTSGKVNVITRTEIGGVDKQWYLLVSVPEEVMLATSNRLRDEISSRSDAALSQLIIAAVILAGVGFVVINIISNQIVKPIVKMRDLMKDIAEGEGDLTKHIRIYTQDETSELATWINKFIDNLANIVRTIDKNASSVNAGCEDSEQVANVCGQDLATSRDSVDRIVSEAEQMSQASLEVTKNIQHVAEVTDNTNQQVLESSAAMDDLVNTMGDVNTEVNKATSVIGQLNDDIEQITNILTTIQNIANQTNLLALNAAIEAARAGEQGRGFAVVADEVRTLASSTQSAVEETQDIIQSIQTGSTQAVNAMAHGNQITNAATTLVEETGTHLNGIRESMEQITGMTSVIAAAAEEQNQLAHNMSKDINNIGSDVSGVAQRVIDLADRSKDLAKSSHSLIDIVHKFKV
ncbi:methyl-accepting chemotaxis protein [Planctobacterium marinum]|uniref:Methyl-accepting chemotaxis protein n=1 Tax=Planctobacterium marinum TaxID=1631968 RepID=A0AA48HCY6_9ALTE|nr:methyl-accepting chemotaxis protein [Planctobacterium marinum]